MDRIVEQDTIFLTFVKAFKSGRLAHAYLLAGDPRGAAGGLAEKILCLLFCGEEDEKPCFSCVSCRNILGRTEPDVLWCEPKNKSRTIAVEQITEVQNSISRKSFKGGWKAVVFIGAERMNPDAANKFLKILEEPPPNTMFLLLSALPDEILPTVLSRCQKVKLQGVARNEECDRIVAEIMSRKSGAEYMDKMAKALEFCRVLGEWKSEITEKVKAEIAENLGTDGYEETGAKDKEVIEARIEAEYKEKRSDLLRSLELWFRDVLIYVAGGDMSVFRFREYAEEICATGGMLTFGKALDNIRITEEMNRQLNMYFAEQSVFERGFAGIAG